MKKFLTLFLVIIALCRVNFAQKKTSVDPCLSANPRVRATAKKPCPTATSSKKTTPPKPPKGSDTGETSNEDSDSDESPSNGKTGKKTNPPAKDKTVKGTDYLGTFFYITIVHNGEKTELAMTQFEEGAGKAMIGEERGKRMNFFYGASNSVKNDEDFAFYGMIPTAAKGTYALGSNDVSFSFKTDKFPNVPIFGECSGSYDITAMPLPSGFVEGTFSVTNCTGELNPDGTTEKYSMNGRFKLLRMT